MLVPLDKMSSKKVPANGETIQIEEDHARQKEKQIQDPGVNKKPQKFIFEYWAFSQKSYLNGGCFEEIHICIPKILYLHTS